MGKDWQETTEKQDQPAEGSSKNFGEAGQRSMQGESKAEQQDWPGDRSYVDREGRDMALRTYDNGDHQYIRAYDRDVQQPPENVNPGQAGYANLRIEQGDQGARGRLQDIKTSPGYEGSGTGSQMLDQAEDISRQKGASEIYGQAPDDAKTQGWYGHRGYQLRDGSQGHEVYKQL